jgi:hypothetical protein
VQSGAPFGLLGVRFVQNWRRIQPRICGLGRRELRAWLFRNWFESAMPQTVDQGREEKQMLKEEEEKLFFLSSSFKK